MQQLFREKTQWIFNNRNFTEVSEKRFYPSTGKTTNLLFCQMVPYFLLCLGWSPLSPSPSVDHLNFTAQICFWVFFSCLWYQYLQSIARELWTLFLALVRRYWCQAWDSSMQVLDDLFLFLFFLPDCCVANVVLQICFTLNLLFGHFVPSLLVHLGKLPLSPLLNWLTTWTLLRVLCSTTLDYQCLRSIASRFIYGYDSFGSVFAFDFISLVRFDSFLF
jgi:hypothetical protein